MLALVAGIATPDRCPPDAGSETPLGEGGFWLDSVGLLEMILACEAEFGITFDPKTELTPDTLRTLGSLTEVIRARGKG